MTIYIEANFILEAALEQERLPSVVELRFLVRARSLKLKCPAVAFGEALSRISNRNAWRTNFKELILKHEVLRDLSRSGLHLTARQKVEEITKYVEEMLPAEEERLHSELDRFLREGGELLPIVHDYFQTAFQLRRDRQMRLADSHIAAAILKDLYDLQRLHQLGDSIFVTSDKGFAPIGQELKSLGCLLITNFQNAVERVKHVTAPL